jgi:DNA repair exonuclease SbcCD ATPase subunit
MMYVKSIEIEQFRQYTGKTTIDGLENGLCIIAGSNEAGKSTLLQAVRACLFDRHKSSIGKQFRPFGADVSPSVSITFEIEDVEYKLSKVFSTKKEGETVLEFKAGKGNQRKEGDEAQAYLAELLDFYIPKSGASKQEMQGLAGLLWVDQARAYENVELSDNPRRRVQSVFEGEMRDLLGGESGDAIHQRITAMWSEFYGKNGNPIGDYRKFADSVEAISGHVSDRKTELSDYEDKVDRLETLQKELLNFEEDNSLAVAKKRLSEAQESVKQLQGLRNAVSKARSFAELKGTTYSLAKKDYTTRTLEDTSLRDLEEQKNDIEGRISTLADKLVEAEGIAASATTKLDELNSKYRDKENLVSVANDIERLKLLRDEMTQKSKNVMDAQEVDRSRRKAIADRDKIALNEDNLESIRELQRSIDLTTARLEAVATSLDYQLSTEASVILGGDQISGTGTGILTKPTTLEIAGTGTFTVRPGGDELDSQNAILASFQVELDQILRSFGMDTLESAESMLRQKGKHNETANRLQASLEGMAPDGISALEDQLSTLQAKKDALEDKLGDQQELDIDIELLRSEIDTLAVHISEQDELVKEHVSTVSRRREEAAGLRAEKKQLLRQFNDANAALRASRSQATDEDLLTAYTSSKAANKVAKNELEEINGQLEAENPELVESEHKRAERVVSDLESDIAELMQQVRDLKVELSALGQRGLSEELADAQEKLAIEQLKYDVLNKQARALDLLKRTLDESLSSAKELAARPITEKLVPYLKQLIPDATPIVDENMVLVGIERNGTHEPFPDLSIGTREQLAVLIRLAYADLLAEAGQPVSVILDDALVNSDDERRDRMKSILFNAAQRYQIIVLTCHGREYRDSGGQFVRLEERVG